MAISLFEHNASAYEAALSMLAETGKACVVHPTGTGKSFIAFRYCEDHPEERICWISPSEYIFSTQCENLSAAGAEVPENITFLTYAKLHLMPDEELAELHPDAVILDEFHRGGAPTWQRSLFHFLELYPNVKLIGLSATSIRYLDGQRDMAKELFSGNVASEMTLGDAIVRGILNAPTYVLSVFAFQKDYDRMQKRAALVRNKAVRDQAERYLEALRRTLEMADGLDVIFDRHMTDRRGKYLVFCASAEHMREMMSHVPEWFGKIDEKPHIYSVYADDPMTDQSFRAFKNDDSDHLKLLFCIDMLNEGIHVEDVSGVILFRPTVSPIIYKQQIGRALSASKAKEPVIFDIVNNIENLYSIDAVEEEMQTAITYYHTLGLDSRIVNERFRVIDEVRDCMELFGRLSDTLGAPWELLYAAARSYFKQNGNLLAPMRYVTEEGYRLGQWLITQRVMHKRGQLSATRTQKLERIGMDWRGRNERCWEDNLAAAEEYVREHGTLEPPSGSELARWLNHMRVRRRQGLLTEGEEAALKRLGIVWECMESSWTERLEQMRAYFVEHGNMNIPGTYVTKDGFHLGRWYSGMKRQYRSGTLPKEKREQLEQAGILWSSVHLSKWARHYRDAKAFYEENGHLDIPRSYVTEKGFPLAVWVSTQRQRHSKGELTEEQTMLLEKIGVVWEPTDTRWEEGFRALQTYQKKCGTANAPADYITQNGFKLGQWLNTQRKAQRRGELDSRKQKRLEDLGVTWNVRQNKWQLGFDHAAAFARAYGHLNVKHQYIAEDGYKLGVWISTQRERYRDKRLGEDEIRALEAIGMKWRGEYHRGGREAAARAEA